MSVTIIGAGEMSAALAALLTRGGMSLQILSRRIEPASALAQRFDQKAGVLGEPVAGGIVVLAVPFVALDSLVERYGDQWSGRIIVDPTNPADPIDGARMISCDSSAAALLQARLPECRVVKAFNTTFASALGPDSAEDDRPAALVAGDDAEACAEVVELIQACDVAAVGVGPLIRARELEALAVLQGRLADRGVISRRGGFALRYG